MKIYFCEKCGISIPLQEVVGGRATARDGKTYCQGCHPGGGDESGDLKLYFCDNCKLSIPLQDVITNQAKAVGEQMLCVDCAKLDEPQRSVRRNRIHQEMQEEEESRYRLHFCDSCNTSIPQSHLVTGRAVLRGGRTFCERCRGRAERRGVGSGTSVLVVIFLAVVFAAGYVALGGGQGLLGLDGGKEQGPSLEDTIRETMGPEIDGLASRIEEYNGKLAGDRKLAEAARQRQGTLVESIRDMNVSADEQSKQVGQFRADVERRLSVANGSFRSLEEKIAALTAQLEELRRRQAEAAAPPPAEPKTRRGNPEPEEAGSGRTAPEPAEPTPEPAAQVPGEVQKLIDRLSADDAGIRFSAAVELGKVGHKSAAGPLVTVLEKDKDTFVRRAAARSLGELDAWTSVPALISTLVDKEFFVAITAHKAIVEITSQDFGFKDGLSRNEIRKVVQKAKSWWDDHKNDRD